MNWQFPIDDAKLPLPLDESGLIGKGTRRYCYHFPDMPRLCIKIPKVNRHGKVQQRREVKYYQSLSRRGVPTNLITNYHGSLQTSLGKGYVYDAVRDADGSISRSLAKYTESDPARYPEYIKVLDAIENYLFDHLVIVYDLNAYNILCRQNDQGNLEPFIIDGVGDIVAIPVLNLSKNLVRQKIRRRWLRFINRMTQKHDWMSEYSFIH